MTESQAIRQERRRRREARRRAERERKAKVFILTALTVLAMMMLMGLAEGCVSDAELDAMELAHWQSQGVTISRW